MKTTKLSEISIILEKYGEAYDPDFYNGDMTKEERLFVSGLIKYYEPKNILEIGVAGGGGSANILNTIKDMDTMLTSLDIAEVFDHPFIGPVKVGEYVLQEFGDVSEDKWRLMVGKDPSERMQQIDTVFDFLVLDTAHVHPIESLNFLTALPYLSEKAIVVLHDTTLYVDVLERERQMNCFACRILMASVCADKLIPQTDGFGGFTNIVAFQLSSETRKYVRNIFDSLMLPWECFPETIGEMGSFIDAHYPVDLQKIFWDSVELNVWINFLKNPKRWLKELKKRGVVFYGAGNNMKRILSSIRLSEEVFDFPIWDINAESIKECSGYKVAKPELMLRENENREVIITISDKDMVKEVQEQLLPLGYKVFHGLRSYLFFIYTDDCRY